jgi:ribulose-5-phosphate 4-epimerase/fuculose-1-phosphate aldolase
VVVRNKKVSEWSAYCKFGVSIVLYPHMQREEIKLFHGYRNSGDYKINNAFVIERTKSSLVAYSHSPKQRSKRNKEQCLTRFTSMHGDAFAVE